MKRPPANRGDGSSTLVAHELLGKVLSGEIPDEDFINHLWSSYDPSILGQIFERVKSLADSAFKCRDYSKAIEHYTSCILLVKNTAERSKLYSNRSLSFFKNGSFAEAYSDGLKCIALTPKWAKAWYRAGVALLKMEKYELALHCLSMSQKYVTTDDQRTAIKSEIGAVQAKIEAAKRIRRYQTDYNRFDRLAQIIKNEEEQQKLAAAATPQFEFIDDDDLENSHSLNEEQKQYLHSQLTGEPIKTNSSAQILQCASDLKVALDWRNRTSLTTSPTADSKAALILREFLLLQSYTAWSSRFINLIDSGISKIFVEKIRMRLNLSSPSKIICLGAGSILVPLVLASKIRGQVLCITDSAMQMDLISTLHKASTDHSTTPGATPETTTTLRTTTTPETTTPETTTPLTTTPSPITSSPKITPPPPPPPHSGCLVTFETPARALDSSAKESRSLAVSLGFRRSAPNHHHHFDSAEEEGGGSGIDLESLSEKNKGDKILRDLGEKLMIKSSSSTSSASRRPSASSSSSAHRGSGGSSCMVVIDPEWICPYLLGPNGPAKFLKNWRDHALLLPTRITLNVALAQIDRFSPDVNFDESCYSVLPLPLPTAYSAHCHIVHDFVAAWTLHKFSEIPAGPKACDNVISVNAAAPCPLKKDPKFNAIIFSLSFFDGDELFMDTWELYQDCSEKKLDMKALAPHFYWLHTDTTTTTSGNASGVTTSTLQTPPRASPPPSPQPPLVPSNKSVSRVRSSNDYYVSTPPDRILLSSTSQQPVETLRRSLSSSSSSSADLTNYWIDEIKRGMLLSGQRESARRSSARSSQPNAPQFREAHRISIQLINGCISGVNVISEDGLSTSSEDLVVSSSLKGLDWFESELLDAPLPLRPQPPSPLLSASSILLTPKALNSSMRTPTLPQPPPPQSSSFTTTTTATTTATTTFEETKSLNSLWIENLMKLRDSKCSEITSRQRRIRAHMIGMTNKRVFMRSLVLNISKPGLIFNLILALIKRGSDHLAENIIDLHCGLDLFCESRSSLKMTRALLKNPQKLNLIRDQLMNIKKYKNPLEWRTGSSGGGSGGGGEGSFGHSHQAAQPPGVKDVTKFLFDDRYLVLSQAVDISQLRPGKDVVEREELLRALSMLYDCSPQTPGLESFDGLIECKQRYDLVIYETPESLGQMTDWVNSGYLRRLIYAKQALAERSAAFYPRKLILKGFLAWVPSGLEEQFGWRGGEPSPIIDQVMELRSSAQGGGGGGGILSYDSLSGARRLSNVITILQIDLHAASPFPDDLLSEKTIRFEPLSEEAGAGSATLIPIIKISQDQLAAKDSGDLAVMEAGTDATSADDQASENSQMVLHEINLEESNSLLRATSAALDYSTKEEYPAFDPSPASGGVALPPRQYKLSSQENPSTQRRMSDLSEPADIFPPEDYCGPAASPDVNAIITFAEYGSETFILSHAPLSCLANGGGEGAGGAKSFPVPKQRYHRVDPVIDGKRAGEGIQMRWNMTAQGQDYEFKEIIRSTAGVRSPRRKAPKPPSRVKQCLEQINARQSEIAVKLSHLMSVSSEATVQLQEAALMLSTCDEIKAPEAINSIIFSSLN